jgi:hypothetical protein
LQVKARKRAGSFLHSALIASAAALFAVLPATDASAQFFSRIFGRGEYREVPPSHAYARPDRGDRGSSGNPFTDFFGIFRDDRDKEEDKTKGNAFANYCVRTCDGKFFPVNRGGKGDLSLGKVCEAMCPSAETKIFSGAGIENATATDGKKYMSLPNALAYRKGIVNNCSCNGRDPFGVVSINIENDPTLRTGDIVVQPAGIVVFRGTTTAPHKTSDFTPIKNAPNMNPALVKQLMAIRVLPNNPNAPFAMTVTVRQMLVEPEVVKTDVKAEPTPANAQQKRTPNANAPVAVQQPTRAN